MPEILRREDIKLTAAIQNGAWVKGVGLDLDKPWDHCWSLLGTPDVKEWTENFKDHTTMILTGMRNMDLLLAGDVKIAAGSGDHLPATGTETPAIANLRTKPPPAKATRTIKDREPNLKLPACEGFNSGKCNGRAGEPCPAFGGKVQTCSQCSSGKRSYQECPQVSREPANKPEDRNTSRSDRKRKQGPWQDGRRR